MIPSFCIAITQSNSHKIIVLRPEKKSTSASHTFLLFPYRNDSSRTPQRNSSGYDPERRALLLRAHPRSFRIATTWLELRTSSFPSLPELGALLLSSTCSVRSPTRPPCPPCVHACRRLQESDRSLWNKSNSVNTRLSSNHSPFLYLLERLMPR